VPGSETSFSDEPSFENTSEGDRPDWINLQAFLDELGGYDWGRPEDAGELRLVAWADGPMPGQELEPEVDRHRGFTLVVAHLRYGPTPSPDDPIYSTYEPEDAGDDDRDRPAEEPDRP
jgi:hypothetical protein